MAEKREKREKREKDVGMRAAVIEEGRIRRVEPARRPKLAETELVKLLEDAGMVPTSSHVELSSHVLLTPRVPWVDGKGHLNALNPRTYYSDGDSINFIPEEGQPTGRVEVWLDGLAAGATYLARFEVGSIGSHPFDVRAVTLGAGLVAQTFQTSGGFDTLLLQFDGGDGGLGLMRVECPDWSFYEAEVSRLDS